MRLLDQFKIYLHIDLRCFDANMSVLALNSFNCVTGGDWNEKFTFKR